MPSKVRNFAFTVADMTVDGHVPLLDKGTQVAGMLEMWTKDGMQLEACNNEDGKRDIVKAAKTNAEDYLAEVASGATKGGGDVAGPVAKTEIAASQQRALISTIKEPTQDELDRQAKQAEADKANAAIAP